MGALAMAATKLYFFSFLLFFSLPLGCSKGSHGETESHHHVFRLTSLLPKPTTVCSTSNFKDDRRSTLRVANRHGPCSPLGSKKVTVTQMLQDDQSRVDSLQSRISGRVQAQVEASLAQSTLPTRSGSSFNTPNYIVTVGFGTPKMDMTVVFDTGSDITWIQCQPCAGSCYSQQEKIFDPSQSSTYLNVSCNSAECLQIPIRNCSSSTCLYGIQYGDNSFTIGFFAHETLTLTSNDVFPNFPFGCGQDNEGLFGTIAGLLGLGRGKLSFVSQTAQKFGAVFSYCLPTSRSTGYLTFGGYKPSSTIKFTPLLTDSSKPSFYFLNLVGIAVEARNLPISASVFSTAGTIIDSGTVITRLPPSAYAALRTAFRQAMSQYPSAPPLLILDTCFNLSGYSSIKVPKIQLQFQGGTNVDLPVIGILLGSSASQVCLAFAGNSDAGAVAIIGNRQQQTFEVVYDVAMGRVGFGAGGCS